MARNTLPLGRIFNRATTLSDSAIAVHHTATEDSAWDGPAAVSAMPNTPSVLKYCHAWQDGTGSDVKEDYKFPHHRKQGGPANIPACRNGLARLENSSIPDGDKAGVKAHLQAHIDDHNKSNGDGDAEDSVGTFLARRREALKASGTPTAGRKWYSIQARAATPSEVDVLITGEIGWDIDSGMFSRALAAPDVANASVLHVSLNSVGGDVFDGIGIYNALVGHGAQIIVTVTGIAASIASVIAMAGDKVIMGRGSQMMIHDAHAIQVGNAADMTKMAEILDRASNNIATFYAERAGGTPEQWRAIMQEERWSLAQEAVDAGLADEVAVTPERQQVAADPAITLAAKVRHIPPANRATTGAEGGTDKPGSMVDAYQNAGNQAVADLGLADLLKDLGAELVAEYAPPVNPLDGYDLGADIRSAVAFAATNVAEPIPTPVDDSLPERQFTTNIADLRRSIREGM